MHCQLFTVISLNGLQTTLPNLSGRLPCELIINGHKKLDIHTFKVAAYTIKASLKAVVFCSFTC